MKYTKEQREMILKWRRSHLNQQRIERADLERRRRLAATSVDKFTHQPHYALMMADFITATRGDTPRFRGEQVALSHFESRILGVEVVCGDINGYLIYVTDNLVDKGANVMVELQRQMIKDLAELLKQKGHQMVESLLLQFDNGRENKNKEMMFYQSMLVEAGIFKSIQVNFLMVGHTHANVDQYFSTISKLIKKQALIATPPALRFMLETMLGVRPLLPPRQVDVLHDYVSAWAKAAHSYKFYQTPHEFLFVPVSETPGAKCKMLYKMYSDRATYLPKEPPREIRVQSPLAESLVEEIELPDVYAFAGNRTEFLKANGLSDPPDVRKKGQLASLNALEELNEDFVAMVKSSTVEMYGEIESETRPIRRHIDTDDDVEDVPLSTLASEWAEVKQSDLQLKSDSKQGYIIWLQLPVDQVPLPKKIVPAANDSGAVAMATAAAALLKLSDVVGGGGKIVKKVEKLVYDKSCFRNKFFTALDKEFCDAHLTVDRIVNQRRYYQISHDLFLSVFSQF